MDSDSAAQTAWGSSFQYVGAMTKKSTDSGFPSSPAIIDTWRESGVEQGVMSAFM